ncbi:uncharacterized protein V1516DRAFT_668395 [Lipomyces oligophaga]|uniref:uncharacterized protein n=1 Tax=Lipomyces oligophaga TaxID=45792 RepID=UPI0034CD5EAC
MSFFSDLDNNEPAGGTLDRPACRICRGEGTPEEPLYHPCKCRGSIKYVHQECLQEWLQHSKRKPVCELCKVRFKFTKVYAENMPSRLPSLLLLQKLFSHIRSSFLFYLRFLLAAAVWLGWLPLTARYSVRFLFWVGDEIVFTKSSPVESTWTAELSENSTLAQFNNSTLEAASNSTTVSFLTRTFTKNAVISKLLVDTFEGHVITGVIVLTFVNIFLIREWVLQNAAQNPEQAAVIDEHQEENAQIRDNHIDRDNDISDDESDDEELNPFPLPEQPEDIAVIDDSNGIQDGAEAFHDWRLRRRNIPPEAGPVLAEDEEGHVLDQFNDYLAFASGANLGANNANTNDTNNTNNIVQDNDINDHNVNDNDIANDHDWDAEDAPERHEVEEIDIQHQEVPAFQFPEIQRQQPPPVEQENNAANRFDENDGLRNFEEELDEEVDDFEGVLEILGIRGPFPGLFQNGLLAAVLIACILTMFMFIPYIFGRFAVFILRDPVEYCLRIPLQILFYGVNSIVDMTIVFLGYGVFGVRLYIEMIPSLAQMMTRNFNWYSSQSEEKVITDALVRLRGRSYDVIYSLILGYQGSQTERPGWLIYSKDVDHIVTVDRIINIGAGYGVISILLGLWMANVRLPFQRLNPVLAGILREVLLQGTSILKVVVIIGIELVVFPLFCGFLLDISTLPIFENVSVLERWSFSIESPCASIFLHWFVGTCYMFHFALFVSMCRDIVRPGVLYFIRDPNDPNFHPIREVLDRSFIMQIYKILVSGVIYCGLICICLGGVVFFLRYGTGLDILPIQWHWGRAMASAPVVFLFYYMFVPYFLRIFKSDGVLKQAWRSFLRFAARQLRLTSFLFNEQRPNEQGYIAFKSWKVRFRYMARRPVFVFHVSTKDEISGGIEAGFIRDGGYVRVPKSDSHRLERGERYFTPVTKANTRLDGNRDNAETFRNTIAVYSPPHLRARIITLMVSIWMFAIFTGLLATVVPLMLGRQTMRILGADPRESSDVLNYATGGFIMYCLYFSVSSFTQNREYIRDRVAYYSRAFTNVEALWEAGNFVFKVAVVVPFLFGAVPLLLGTMVMIYLAMPFNQKNLIEPMILDGIHVWALGAVCENLIWITSPARVKERICTTIFGPRYPEINKKHFLIKFSIPVTLTGLAFVILPPEMAKLGIELFEPELSPEIAELIIHFSYPGVFLLCVFGVAVYFLNKLFYSWKRTLLDEVYLVGEQLNNYE